MYAWQFSSYLHMAKVMGMTRFVSMQNHYNLVYREEEREMLPLCAAEGTGIIFWSPLVRGFLANNSREQTRRAKSDQFAHAMYQESDFSVVDAVSEVARTRGVCNAQVALAWLLHKSTVTAPIIGPTKMIHLEEAVAATLLNLDDAEHRALEAPYAPHRVLGHL